MNLTVQKRELSGKGSNRVLRKGGNIPGVVYGKEKSFSVSMSTSKAHRFIHTLGGSKTVFPLTIEEDGKSREMDVLVQDFQVSNLGNRLLHVDFMEVTPESFLTIEVPIETTEDCIAVKMGGTVNIIRRSVPVRCAVKNIPDKFVVDIRNLTYGESVHVLDIDYPEGVKPKVTGRNWTLITVTGKAKEEVVEEVAEEAAEEPAE